MLILLWLGMASAAGSAPQAGFRKADPNDEQSFLQFQQDGTFHSYKCNVEWGTEQLVWDEVVRRCVPRYNLARLALDEQLSRNTSSGYQSIKPRLKRQVGLPSSAQIGLVGAACAFNTDCLSGAYCEVQRCQCYTTFIAIGGYCKPKINPEQSGCETDLQCTAVWPGTTCDKSVTGNSATTGICRCPFNTQPISTLDGPVCFIPNECPTNGANPKLTQNGLATLETCTFFAIAPNPLSWVGCQPDGGPGRTMGIMQDCIPDTPANPPVGNPPSQGYCCPSRSFACTQPQDSGNAGNGLNRQSTRWFYNSINQVCSAFTFNGAGGNANNFVSQEQCESYCSNTCQRGNPQYINTNIPTIGTNAQSNNWRYCSTGQSGFGVVTTCGAQYQCEAIGTQNVCCPNPTFVCGQLGGIQGTSLFQGTVRGSVPQNSQTPRWRWDPTQGQCVSFTYNGQAGDYNNFFSQDDCNSFCSKSLCAQGEPLKDNSGLRNLACGGSTACPADYECTNSVCCPRVRTVCNQPIFSGASSCGSGASIRYAYIPSTGSCQQCTNSVCCPRVRTVCNQPIFSGASSCGSGASIRYAYIPSTGSCQQFTYTGCLGNANNFATINDCQTFCSGIAAEPKCEQGKAYKDTNGLFYSCNNQNTILQGLVGSTNPVIASCPPGFTCDFDTTTGTSGCCPTRQYTCTSLSLDQGRACNPTTSTRYYFDSSTQTCKSFQYFGCDGNSNNFPTKRDCDDYCGTSGCPNGGSPAVQGNNVIGQPFRCNVNQNFANGQRTCPLNFECTAISLSLFPGQTTATSTASVCCPNRIYICSQTSDIGTQCLTQALTRWFYNPGTRNCQQFTYRGCGGNANNFPSQERCNNFCLGAACATGEGVFKDSNNNVQTCQPGQLNACPSGFRCTANPLNLGQGICCGANDGGVCPVGQAAFINGATNSPRTCIPNALGNCPAQFLCVYDSFSSGGSGFGRQSYCCGPRTSPECPAGSSVLIDPNTNGPQACTLRASDVCNRVPGYTCQETTATAGVYGYCCTGATTSVIGGVCGSGSPQIGGNGGAVTCSQNFNNFGNVCRPGYSCTQSATQNGLFYCCSPVASTTVCPVGEVPYYGVSNNQLGTCNPTGTFATFGNVQRCPGNGAFTCRSSSNGNGQSYCCTPVDSGAYCGEARVYLEGGTQQPRSCQPEVTTGVNNCPAGYVCELSAPLGAYYCCSGSGCPVGYEGIATGNGGAAQTCTSGAFNSCPAGYSCVQGRGVTNVFRCCRPTSAGQGTCPNGGIAYIDGATGQAQACAGVAGAAACPAGYACTTSTTGGGFAASVCCQGGGAVGQCPAGQTPSINPSTGTPNTCASVGAACAAGGVCTSR